MCDLWPYALGSSYLGSMGRQTSGSSNDGPLNFMSSGPCSFDLASSELGSSDLCSHDLGASDLRFVSSDLVPPDFGSSSDLGRSELRVV